MSLFFNFDLATTLINDVHSLVLLSQTCHDVRKYASLSISNQFTNLLKCLGNCATLDIPTLENRIHAKWIKINTLIQSNKDETGCFSLKLFSEAFDLLKIFYKIIPIENQQKLLQLNCPSLIKEMVSPCCLNINPSSKMNSIIKELKKLGLFYEGIAEEHPYKHLPFQGCTGGVLNQIDVKEFWLPKLHFATYQNNHIQNQVCKIDLNDSKWQNIKTIYSNCFGVSQNGQYITALSDLEDIWLMKKEQYKKIYDHATNLNVFNSENLELLEDTWCVRLSQSSVDIYGNLKFVVSYKNINGDLYNNHLDLTLIKSIEQFDQILFSAVEELKKKLYDKIRFHATQLFCFVSETDPNLNRNEYCVRISGSELDIYGNQKIVISYKHINGNTYNSRFDLTTIKSIKDFDLLMRKKLMELGYSRSF